MVMKNTRRVLFATDFSPASRRAFATALSLATGAGSKLTVLHVLTPMVPAVPEQYLLDADETERLERRAREWSVRELQKLTQRAARRRVATSILVRQGDPARRIVEAGTSTRADFIVVGTHGRRALPKFFIGSVAEQVIRLSRRPVVVVRGA